MKEPVKNTMFKQGVQIIRKRGDFLRVGKGKRRIKEQQIIIESILMTIVWSIWLKRNRRIFNNAHLNIESLCAIIENNIALWTDSVDDEACNTFST